MISHDFSRSSSNMLHHVGNLLGIGLRMLFGEGVKPAIVMCWGWFAAAAGAHQRWNSSAGWRQTVYKIEIIDPSLLDKSDSLFHLLDCDATWVVMAAWWMVWNWSHVLLNQSHHIHHDPMLFAKHAISVYHVLSKKMWSWFSVQLPPISCLVCCAARFYRFLCWLLLAMFVELIWISSMQTFYPSVIAMGHVLCIDDLWWITYQKWWCP